MEPRATSLLQIVDRQVRRWEFLREERRASAKRVHWPIITIAREFGARGEALGRTLAEGIDFSFWDQELVHAMAEESGANEAFLATVDEYRRNVIEDSVDGALMGGKYMNSAYIRRLVKLVHTIATQGSSVVVGRGAHYVVAPDEALRVRVVCSLEERVRRYSEHEGTSLDAARKILDREDAARARFLRHNYGSDGTNPADYDLIVNTGPIPLERAAAPILAAYEAKFARRPGEAETRTPQILVTDEVCSSGDGTDL